MKYIIFKKLEDGTYGEKLGSYEGPKDDSSANRSYLQAEPLASHFELPEGMDEDCVVLIDVEGLWVLQEDSDLVAAKAAATIDAMISKKLEDAMAFGTELMKEFTRENIKMGITQDNMTGTVRKNMAEVIMALQTGSLYDAITEAKAITNDKKDSKYITDARLLSFINKIETQLGVALTQSL